MEWCRLYARLRHDQAVQNLTDSQFRLFVESLCYATEAESDGHIPTAQLPKFGKPGSPRNAAALVTAELWTDLDDGWLITKWQTLQEDLETVRKRRKKDAERKAASRAEKAGVRTGVRGGLRAGLHEGVLPVDREEEKRTTHQSPPGTEVDVRDPNGGGRLGDLVDQVRAVRPFWSPAAVADAARRCADAGRSYDATLAALLAVADDPATIRPGRVIDDGPWWRPPIERTTRSTTDERVAAGLALAEQLAAEQRRAELRALPGGAA